MSLPESRWASALSARFAELIGSRPQPDPYATAHELSEAMPLSHIPLPMRPDNELLPGRDDLEDEACLP